MMNFIEPAKRKRAAVRPWAVQSRRLTVLAVLAVLVVLALELDMVGSPVAFWRLEEPGNSGICRLHYHVEPPSPKSTRASRRVPRVSADFRRPFAFSTA